MTLSLRTFALALGALALALPLCACASYTEKVEGALRDFESGNFDAALAEFSDRDRTGSRFLSGAEAGMVALVAGDWERAVAELSSAASLSDALADRGALSLTSSTEALGSLLLNDTVTSYEGEGFERVYAHAALAMGYLGLGDLDGARVETRRANALLESEEELYDTRYPAGGLGHFMSAALYLLGADYDDALIDLRRMLAKDAAPQLAGPLARWIAERSGRDDLTSELRGFSALELPAIQSAPAWIVLVAGVGSAPYKVERTIAFPTSAGVVTTTSPDYVPRAGGLRELELRVDGRRHPAHLLEDVTAVAMLNLEDRLGAAALRSVARNAGRLAIRKQVSDSHGEGAAALVDLFSLAMERADLRSWLTLPAAFRGTLVPVAPGNRELELALGGDRAALGTYALEPGEFLFVLAREVAGRMHVHPLGGARVDFTAP